VVTVTRDAQKLSTLQTEASIRKRVAKAKRLLKKAGRGRPTIPGDERK
jgi:hypothetical protein